MDCNRDEAFRAKGVAEKKMMNNDFEGAKKIALKARQLFPELENISQMIAVCDVHCSAQRKIYGAEKDLYGILQVESPVDEATIRKQYRKLALVLHPDKNKFPGAEAAFKLIGEANMTLSDKGKRSVYDIKCREPAKASVTKLQTHQGNQKPHVKAQFNGMNHGQQSASGSTLRSSFWTYCPFCNIKYEYYRDFVNRPLRCQHCSKLFIAYDIGAQGAAPQHPFGHDEMQRANRAQPDFAQPKEVGKREKVKVNIQKDGRFPSYFANTTCSSAGMPTQHTRTEAQVNGQKKPREAGISKDKNRKRERKIVEDDEFDGIGVSPTGKGFVGDSANCRRSSRQKQKVSYSEDAGDGLSPVESSKPRKLSSDVEDMQKDQVSGCEDNVCKTAEVSVKQPNGKYEEKHKVKGEESVTLNDHAKSDLGSEADSGPEVLDCRDPEFSNFDKDKEEHCFAVDQIWACYDSIDSMPRFYARIRRVYSSEFRLRITWLEAEPEKDPEVKWADEGLPVACGKFVRGDTEETRDRLMFSHQIAYVKSGTKFSYLVYPKKGEIWALFKDWDIKWSLDPKSHRKYKFDIVEILSEYDNGVSVAHLVKVKGFVSLFQRTVLAGQAELKIPSSEVFRFSHRIPSVKLTGTERAGVPSGSFELDPASLPDDFEDYHFATENVVQSHEEKAKPTTGLACTPKKLVNSEERNGLLNLRRSPRGVKGGDKNQSDSDINTPSKNFTKSPRNTSSSPVCRKLEQIIHDFNADKQIWKFQVGQIWALYLSNEGIHHLYAEIKHIEAEPLRLHVSLLNPCSFLSNHTFRHDACGLFKVSPDQPKVLRPDSFSHIVKAEVDSKSIFDIHPREQQIWVLYKRQERDKYEIVQVLESDEISIKVLPLARVAGYKSVFKAPVIQRSIGRILVIPRIELNRFSLQVPAFRFTEEKDGCLRGCWELDPAALAGLPLLGSLATMAC